MKHDVWHHPVGPLVLHQRFDFQPSSVVAELLLTQCSQAGIPIPLKGVQAVGGHGVVSLVVELEDVVCFFHHVVGVHAFNLHGVE